MMAAGVIPIAHKSGGPASDIVLPFQAQETGFLAETEAEYAQALERAFSLSDKDAEAVARAARASVSRFSDEAFERSFAEAMAPALAAAAKRKGAAAEAQSIFNE